MAELSDMPPGDERHSLVPVIFPPTLPFDADLLAGQLAASSIAMYRRDFTAYVGYGATHALDPLHPTTLARWRTWLAQATTLSPNTINRMLSAVKRLMAEAAEQGYLRHEVAEAFQDLKGVKRAPSKSASSRTLARGSPRPDAAVAKRARKGGAAGAARCGAFGNAGEFGVTRVGGREPYLPPDSPGG